MDHWRSLCRCCSPAHGSRPYAVFPPKPRPQPGSSAAESRRRTRSAGMKPRVRSAARRIHHEEGREPRSTTKERRDTRDRAAVAMTFIMALRAARNKRPATPLNSATVPRLGGPSRLSAGFVVKRACHHRAASPHQCPSACTISSVIFFASPNSIIVFGRKNSSLSTPAYPDAIDRFTNSTVAALSTSKIGMP